MGKTIKKLTPLVSSEIDKANAEMERVQHETASEVESLANVANELVETRDKLQALQSETSDDKETISDLQVRHCLWVIVKELKIKLTKTDLEKLQSRLAKANRDLETERKLRVKAETDSSETEQRLIELKKRSIKLTKEVLKTVIGYSAKQRAFSAGWRLLHQR